MLLVSGSPFAVQPLIEDLVVGPAVGGFDLNRENGAGGMRMIRNGVGYCECGGDGFQPHQHRE